MTLSSFPTCNRTTKKGERCQRQPYEGLLPGLHPGGDGSCRLHLTPEERARDEGQRAGLDAYLRWSSSTPACRDWAPVKLPVDETAAWYAFVDWHEDRCARCGRKDRRSVEDHDHETGLTRGFLCRGCNIHEGSCAEPWCSCVEYRRRSPAAILGFRHRYTFSGIRGD